MNPRTHNRRTIKATKTKATKKEKTMSKPGLGIPKYSFEEDKYISRKCRFFQEEGSQLLTKEFLNSLARKCNIRFHEGQKFRTGEGLWWHIRRMQSSHNKLYLKLMVPGGAPKYGKTPPKNPRGPSTKSYRKHGLIRGEVKSALKSPKPPKSDKHPEIEKPSREIGKRSHHKKTQKNIPIEILIRTEDGNMKKIVTNKFSSVEELMFALA